MVGSWDKVLLVDTMHLLGIEALLLHRGTGLHQDMVLKEQKLEDTARHWLDKDQHLSDKVQQGAVMLEDRLELDSLKQTIGS